MPTRIFQDVESILQSFSFVDTIHFDASGLPDIIIVCHSILDQVLGFAIHAAILIQEGC